MITPRFYLTQNEETVTIIIRAPYCSLKELDVSVEDIVFIFSCHPYYLRLHLPGKIEENENSNNTFNSNSGEFTFTYDKVNSGEHFEDLQFVTKFLGRSVEVESGNRKIEIIGSELSQTGKETNVDNKIQYGFAMRGGYKFNLISAEFRDVFEIDPHKVKFENRTQMRHKIEAEDFDRDHYLADILDADEISELLKLKAPWEGLIKEEIEFTEIELDFLKDLSNIEYVLSSQQIQYCHNSLLEILYAYCYDCRSTYFEPTCESGWTISKLSSSLCCFDSFSTCKEALVCAFRRSLIYPLYRNFNLCQKIQTDLKCIVNLGEQYIIKCLIQIHNIFLSGDSGRYILNNLFILDYIVYVMKWNKDLWCETVTKLNELVIRKSDLGLDLINVEQLALDEADICSTMAKLNINTCNSATDSDDSLSETETSSDVSTSA